MSVAIIDYGSGNLRSAAKAFERSARQAGHDGPIEVTADPARVRAAERIVLPGVGAFADCKQGLEALPGMIDALEERVRRDGRPFLGICVGMQLMAERGTEHGTHAGLGWIAGDVVAIAPDDPHLKVPHMGWNELALAADADHPLLAGFGAHDHAYFVHSYRLATTRQEDVLAEVEYGGAITALVARDTMAGVQFHPEKSQETGLRLIANFLSWAP
jgi:glutamine amidotransferase